MQGKERGAGGVVGGLALGGGAVALGAGFGGARFAGGPIGEGVAEADDEAEIIGGLDAADAGGPAGLAPGGLGASEAFLSVAPAGERGVAGLGRRAREAGDERLVRCDGWERGKIGQGGGEIGNGGTPE